MAKAIANRRQDARLEVPASLGAEIEFNGPDSRRHRLPLTQVGVVGAAFVLPNQIQGIRPDTTLTDALIRVGQIEIRGNLSVRHTDRGFTSARCGVQFHPLTDSDRNELITFVTRLQALSSAELLGEKPGS